MTLSLKWVAVWSWKIVLRSYRWNLEVEMSQACVLLLVAALLPAQTEADEKVVSVFVDDYCLDCHSGSAAVAGLRLDEQIDRMLDDEKGDRFVKYFTSVRELEQRLVQAEEWEKQPKPIVDVEPPEDIADHTALIERTRLMYQMSKLAFETDSTRIIALCFDQNANPKVNLPGVTEGHHSLTYHGHRQESVDQLKIIESAQLEVFGELLRDLGQTQEEDERLLDRAMVMCGSNLGNANSHDDRNLPMVLAGGGFRHGKHLAFGT